MAASGSANAAAAKSNPQGASARVEFPITASPLASRPSISATLPAKGPTTGTKRKAEADVAPTCSQQRAEQPTLPSHVVATGKGGAQHKAEVAQAAKDIKAGELVPLHSHPDIATSGPLALTEWAGLDAMAALVAEASAAAKAQKQLHAASASHTRELEEARRKTAAAEAILADATKRHGESLSEAQAALAFAAVQRAEELAMVHKTCQELGAFRAARIQQLQDTVATLERAVHEKGEEVAGLRAQHARETAAAAEAARSLAETASQRHAAAMAELQKEVQQAQAATSSVKDQLKAAELTEVRLRKQLQDLHRAEAQLREQLTGVTAEVSRLKERPAVTPLKRQLAATQAEASRTAQQQRQHAQELAEKAQKVEAELRRQLAASQAQATAAQQREQLAQDELGVLKARLDAARMQADTANKQLLAMEKRYHDTEYDLRQQLSAAHDEAAAAQAEAAAALDHAKGHEQQARLSAEIRKQAVAQAANDNDRLGEQVRQLQLTEAALRRELEEQRKTARLTEAGLLEQLEEQVKAAHMSEAALRQEVAQLRQEADVGRQEAQSRVQELNSGAPGEEAQLRIAEETKRADRAEGAAAEERRQRIAAEVASDLCVTQRAEAMAALVLAQGDTADLMHNLKATSEAAAHAIGYANHVAAVLRVNGIVLPQPPGMGPPLPGVAASSVAPAGGWVLAMPGQQPPQLQAPGVRLAVPTFMAPPAQAPGTNGAPTAMGPPVAQKLGQRRQPPPPSDTAAAPAQQPEALQPKASAVVRAKIKRRGPDTPLDKLAEAAAVLEATGSGEVAAQGGNKRARTARQEQHVPAGSRP